MSVAQTGYEATIVCPRLDRDGNNNDVARATVRSIVWSNFPNMQEWMGKTYSYVLEYDEWGNPTGNFTEAEQDVAFIRVFTYNQTLKDNFAYFVDMISSFLNVSCGATLTEISYAISE